MNSKSLVVYELNELPLSVFEWYADKNPDSAFAWFLKKGYIYSTEATDDGELHPWTSWPSVHYGVDSTVHQIRTISQKVPNNLQGNSIWEILLSKKISVGLFGTLQLAPVLTGEHVRFHIPHFFADNAITNPECLRKFQEFNLLMVGSNNLTPTPFRPGSVLQFCRLIFIGTIGLPAALRAAGHVIKEFFNGKYKQRRSVVHSELCFDVFSSLLHRFKPEYATFFTNHVASAMHRYWGDLFGSSSPQSTHKPQDFRAYTLYKALKTADRQINKLIKRQNQVGGDIMIVSALGQESVNWGDNRGQLVLRDQSKFIDMLELESKAKVLPSMHPDILIKMTSN